MHSVSLKYLLGVIIIIFLIFEQKLVKRLKIRVSGQPNATLIDLCRNKNYKGKIIKILNDSHRALQ